ncbi:MAG TPA: T9SS type A sorting domain-containing protein [Chitinophagales bacterium]|nr:T9SS type A sorting domain-containing protein [Chitinophagales bacterium]
MCKYILSFIFVLSFVFRSNAQSVVASAGQEYINGNFVLNFTLGEPVVLTYENSTITLTQGFHQNVHAITTGIKMNSLDVSVTVFPNPTANKLQIELAKPDTDELTLLLFDMNGSIVSQSKLGRDIQLQNIDVSALAAGVYFLQIANPAKNQINIYKVEKINQ